MRYSFGHCSLSETSHIAVLPITVDVALMKFRFTRCVANVNKDSEGSYTSLEVIRMSQDLEKLVNQAESEWIERFVAGPDRLRWEQLPPQIGDSAPDLELQDSTGAWRHLQEFWADSPALLLFWRHFGCGCGIDRAKQLKQEYDEYVEAGATVAIVGEGDPERGAAYADEYGIECPILCDPDGTAHETYGLLDFTPHQIWYAFPDESLRRYRDPPVEVAEEYAEESREDGRPQVDNPWQQPGEFVVDEDGVLRLTYRYQYCKDFPDPQVLTAAIRVPCDDEPVID